MTDWKVSQMYLENCIPNKYLCKYDFKNEVIQLDMKQHRDIEFLVDISWKTSVDLEFNKTMYLLKRFNTDTLVSVKLKRTNMSYLKYYWDGALAEMLRISRSW